MVKEFKVETFEERLFCDQCGAEMRPERVYCSSPLKYLYTCSGCGVSKITNEVYPKMIYKRIEQ